MEEYYRGEMPFLSHHMAGVHVTNMVSLGDVHRDHSVDLLGFSPLKSLFFPFQILLLENKSLSPVSPQGVRDGLKTTFEISLGYLGLGLIGISGILGLGLRQVDAKLSRTKYLWLANILFLMAFVAYLQDFYYQIFH